MVLLAGPRQSGKTTLAKSLLGVDGYYLNWDITKDRKVIRDTSWPRSASLVVLDELHKAPKWKNFLKGLADEFQNKPPLLVTESAKLDAFRKSGDALTGRQYLYRLHPIDLAEAALIDSKRTESQRIKELLTSGGFPEAYFNPADALRLRKDRFDLVLREDLSDLSQVNSWRGPSDLLEILRSQVSQPIKYDGFASDLSVSAPTVKRWIELLEKLYLIFTVPPFFKNISSSIRKERKLYLYDSGAAYDDSLGAQTENVVACSLLKFCHFKQDSLGENWELFYVRDKQQHDVDFVVTKNKKVEWLIEVKKSEDRPTKGLKYFNEKLKPRMAIQLVLELDRKQERDGIHILPLAKWVQGLMT